MNADIISKLQEKEGHLRLVLYALLYLLIYHAQVIMVNQTQSTTPQKIVALRK